MIKKLIFLILFMIISLTSIASLAQDQKGVEDEVYIIKQGDTLWDLSSKYLKNPYSWPKLWQRNPYITNPHWIYPGNPIRLSPLEERKVEEPKKVTLEEKIEEQPKIPEIKKEPEVKKEELVERKPLEAITEEKPKEAKPPIFPEIRSAGFISEKEYKGIGIVLESKEGKSLMSSGDIVYLAFKTSEPVSVGEKYTIFRETGIIKHPVTKRKIGIKYNIIGNLQIIDREGNFYTAKIIDSFDAIVRGDLIQNYMKEKMEVQ